MIVRDEFLNYSRKFVCFLLLLVHFGQDAVQILLLGGLLVIFDVAEEPALRVIHYFRENIGNIIKDPIATALPNIFLVWHLSEIDLCEADLLIRLEFGDNFFQIDRFSTLGIAQKCVNNAT